MTRSDLTHIYFLLDRSGSMQSIKTDTEGGFDAFLDEQRADTTGECRVTLAQFDNEYEVVYADRLLADVPPLQLAPRGSTALLDSLGRLITDAGAKLAALPEDQRPGTVVVAVMTDGHENSSREWTHPAIKSLVEQQTNDYHWQFLYMGADQDAVEVGTSIGVAAGHSVTYTRGKAREAMSATSAKIAGLREARRANPAAMADVYTQVERDDLGK
ncbi:MAG TPA: VWA domain-containing protein [Candidatus Avipropionibacterium avicola]|uniref:VWA domain-containing protein n=1 Tax=Candidatus Avipropionibacterium avicola TaxID=2840701 RepID=A0A9D1KM38_9ACTN|nr:VWA domain-containing protein [Candidatus Avipropionibacterium avicola]